jgi:hypothetical protein
MEKENNIKTQKIQEAYLENAEVLRRDRPWTNKIQQTYDTKQSNQTGFTYFTW